MNADYFNPALGLARFHARHRRAPMFANSSRPLSERDKRRFHSQHRHGKSGHLPSPPRSRHSILEIINRARTDRILALPLDYIPSEEFSRPGARREILAPLPQPEDESGRISTTSGRSSYLAAWRYTPLLTRGQERHLFRKYNFLKYSAAKLRDQLDATRPKAALMDKIEDLHEEAVRTRNHIISASLRLVVYVAKQWGIRPGSFYELISDANMSLLRAIEKYDYSLGNRFSTYATWAIVRNFRRTVLNEFKQKRRFCTGLDEILASESDYRRNQLLDGKRQAAYQSQVNRILPYLNEREQRIIVSRFGLEHMTGRKTLKELGDQLGVTCERVRQIESRALRKLRLAARKEGIELPT